MGDFLAEHMEHSGVVDLTDCEVHWWILDDSEKRRKTSELPNTGHFGALFQGELYEMTTGRGGTARLQQFGVLFGPDRVVLYVEPKNGSERPLSANTARTQLLLRNSPLPYGEWAHGFRANLPQEIRDYMDSVIAGTKGVDNSQSIMERLKAYVKLFRLSRYRSQAGGPLRAGERVSGGRQSGESTSPTDTVERDPAAHQPGSQTGDLLAEVLGHAQRELEEEPTLQHREVELRLARDCELAAVGHQLAERRVAADEHAREAVETVDGDSPAFASADALQDAVEVGRSIVPLETFSSGGQTSTCTPRRCAHSRMPRSWVLGEM